MSTPRRLSTPTEGKHANAQLKHGRYVNYRARRKQEMYQIKRVVAEAGRHLARERLTVSSGPFISIGHRSQQCLVIWVPRCTLWDIGKNFSKVITTKCTKFSLFNPNLPFLWERGFLDGHRRTRSICESGCWAAFLRKGFFHAGNNRD